MNRAERRRAVRYLRQPYVRRLGQAIADGGRARRAGVAMLVEVRHDAWCPKLAGRGLCTCRPELEAVVPNTVARDG